MLPEALFVKKKKKNVGEETTTWKQTKCSCIAEIDKLTFIQWNIILVVKLNQLNVHV